MEQAGRTEVREGDRLRALYCESVENISSSFHFILSHFFNSVFTEKQLNRALLWDKTTQHGPGEVNQQVISSK